MNFTLRLATMLGFLLLLPHTALATETDMTIESGSQVSFTYTLSVDGEVVESNKDKDPLTYTQGDGEILGALEDALAGLQAGDEKTVSLSAAEGYGEVDEQAFQEIPTEQIPEEARVVGALLQSPGYPGPIRVAKVGDETVTLDMNHPLAGKDLAFDITIVSVGDAPAGQ